MPDVFLHIISRETANSLGMKRFFTGIPCNYGHISERFCNEGKCCECNRVRCTARYTKRCAENPERIKRISEAKALAETRKEDRVRRSAAYSARKASRRHAIESGAVHYHGIECRYDGTTLRYTSGGGCVECLRKISCSDEKKKYDKTYVRENAERLKALAAKWRERNRSRVNENSARWRRSNPEKRAAIVMNNKCRRRALEYFGISSADLRGWIKSQIKVCYWCGVDCSARFHVDHYYPLAKGGLHEIGNLVIACPPCNLRKSAKDPIQWANENGKLL